MAKSYLNRTDLPRGIRNNNPGNLIYTTIAWEGKISYANNRDWSGTPTNIVKKFEQFKEYQQYHINRFVWRSWPRRVHTLKRRQLTRVHHVQCLCRVCA